MEKKVSLEVGDNVRRACEKRGWSISRLAKEAGIAQQTIHGWTTGRSPSLEQLKKVADVLESPLYKLAFGTHDPNELEADTILTEIFKGDVRVTLERIEKVKNETNIL